MNKLPCIWYYYCTWSSHGVTNKNSNKVVLGISPVLLLYTGFTLDRVVNTQRKNKSKMGGPNK